MKFLSSLLLLIAPVALSLPVTEAPVEDAALESRQSCYSRCGSTCYTANQVTAARNAGYSFYNQDKTAGSSNYPHQYNNFEGFQFLVSGPYQEFPIRSSGVYSGGSPGADRVIFNTRGQRAGEITHTGASGNAFVACDGWLEDDRKDSGSSKDKDKDKDKDSSSGACMLSGGIGMWAVTFVAGLMYI